MAWAREEFKLDRRTKSGSSIRQHMQAAGQTSLNPHPFPLASIHVWEWFGELSAGRTAGGFAPNPLTWEGIAAWCDLTGTRMAPWEVRAIKALDSAFLASLAPSGA